jgi:hypothetical protein
LLILITVIQAARLVISHERFDQQFIVFLLSMAGIASKDPTEKSLAIEMIRTMGRHSHSRTIGSGRVLVETMYEKQGLASRSSGDPSPMNWVEEVESSAQRLIFYGI